MNLRDRLPKILVITVLVAGVAVIAWDITSTSSPPGSAHIVVKVPQLSSLAKRGEKDFNTNCAVCHGKNASGTDKGPPLVHDIYNPGHHADMAFTLAVRRGTRRHHWPYGDMPPQPQVTKSQLKAIVKYVRELQKANGIVYREHHM
ncbi:MAG: cytochrome c [Rhodospirillaceae bacterium]|jgi:mono/diheme cytochrome c family protein